MSFYALPKFKQVLKVVQKFMRNSLLFEEAVKFWILYLIFDKNTWYLSKSVISCVE